MNEKQASVAAQISALPTLPIAKLWLIWDRPFSSRPITPNRALIESRIACKMQEEIFGGSAHSARRQPEVSVSWLLRGKSPHPDWRNARHRRQGRTAICAAATRRRKAVFCPFRCLGRARSNKRRNKAMA